MNNFHFSRAFFILFLFLFIAPFACETENSLPELNITSPTNGESVLQNSVIAITVLAKDNDGSIAEVVFHINDSILYTDENSPYQYQWNTTNVSGGTHIIKVAAIDDEGGKTEESLFVTVVEVPQKPEADFEVSSSSPIIDELITFTDLSTEEPTAWSWDFGDGYLSALQNPTHIYTAKGVYTVELIATNDIGSDTITKSDYITVIDPQEEAQLLVDYLESGIDPLSWIPTIKLAQDVKTSLDAGAAYIIDIRSGADYATGHIETAVNMDAASVLVHLETTDLSAYDDIVLVCYSGLTSGWLAALMGISGYDNVSAMKWGMASWHEDFAGPWNANVSSDYIGQFEDGAYSKAAAGNLPVLGTGLTAPAEILSARVNTVLAEGFGAGAVTTAMVFANLNDYYVVNYWSEAHYVSYGHIPGAIQYTPGEAFYLDEDLLTLPTDKTIIVYDYTGQTGAGIVAYLRILGYDAKLIKFGANAMIYDNLTIGKWSTSAIAGYTYVSAK